MFSDKFLRGLMFLLDHGDPYKDREPFLYTTDDDVVRVEMKNYGLAFMDDGKDAIRLQWYMKEQYGIDADIDGESLSESDWAYIEGERLYPVNMAGWIEDLTQPVHSHSSQVSFTIKHPGLVPANSQPIGSKQPGSERLHATESTANLSDVDEFFSIPIPRRRELPLPRSRRDVGDRHERYRRRSRSPRRSYARTSPIRRRR
jgi:hypothetical protein